MFLAVKWFRIFLDVWNDASAVVSAGLEGLVRRVSKSWASTSFVFFYIYIRNVFNFWLNS